jgi:hypothetical protein
MAHRFWEILLGLDRGFLGREGEMHWHFNPHWPLQSSIGAASWNLLLAAGALVLVYQVYRREGRSRQARLILGIMRAALLALVLTILNRPVLTLVENRTEPSVLAVLVDDTISMQVRDAAGDASNPTSRLEAIAGLLTSDNAALLRDLARIHVVKLYRFTSAAGASGGAEPLITLDWKADSRRSKKENLDSLSAAMSPAVEALNALKPVGNTTQVVSSVRSIIEGLQGQRVAGVVVLTDGRDTPSESLAEGITAVKAYGIKVYPVPVGSDAAPRNIDIRSMTIQDNAFKGDIVNVSAIVHTTGFEAGHRVHLGLVDAKTKLLLRGLDGLPAEKDVAVDSDKPQTVELPFKATQIGIQEVMVEATPQPGEINDADNRRTSPIEVLDAKINVVYVEGYPRWEYRNIKNEMLREPTINLSCILQSADTLFTQEHTKIDPSLGLKYFPYNKFPESLEQLQEADVVLFGDVDPQRMSDSQLQILRTFVEDYGGGFGMIAGIRWSPIAYRNTPIQDLLPVTISNVQPETFSSISSGFRPVITREGLDSSMFRFFADRKVNEQYIKEKIPPIFWYCRGVTPKPGLGEVYSEHPVDLIGENRKAPLLVVGHFGAGRTLFSATDDSWRWRFYTGESIFDTYWVQQIRYLARSKKLGSRGMTFTSSRDAYEVGEQVRLSLHILNRKLLLQLPEQLSVDITDGAGQTVRRETLVRQEGQGDTYTAQFPADRIGIFTATLPAVTADARDLHVRLDVVIPARELEQPQVDRTLLARLAAETSALLPGQSEPKLIELAIARSDLLKIPSAARSIPLFSDMPLWDAPLAMAAFVLLITTEWVLRKVFGML